MHEVGQVERRRGVLGERARQHRAEPETEHVDHGREQAVLLLAPRGGEVDEGRGRRSREDARREPRQDAADEQRRDVARDEEHGAGDRGEREAGQEDLPAPDLVGEPAEEQESGGDPDRVRREDQGDHHAAEAELLLVDRVERRRQRRAEHRDEEGQGDDGGRGRPRSPRPPGAGLGRRADVGPPSGRTMDRPRCSPIPRVDARPIGRGGHRRGALHAREWPACPDTTSTRSAPASLPSTTGTRTSTAPAGRRSRPRSRGRWRTPSPRRSRTAGRSPRLNASPTRSSTPPVPRRPTSWAPTRAGSSSAGA